MPAHDAVAAPTKRRRFQRRPDQVAAARRFVADALARGSEHGETARLLVSVNVWYQRRIPSVMQWMLDRWADLTTSVHETAEGARTVEALGLTERRVEDLQVLQKYGHRDEIPFRAVEAVVGSSLQHTPKQG